MGKKEEDFARIVRDVKSIKIQGARNVAKASLRAYLLLPSEKSISVLLSSRPTEPMMRHVLLMAEKGISEKEILQHFDSAQDEINKSVFKLIKSNSIIFTHCHSTNVINALLYAKKRGKNFQVYNTETRPLFQGRKTSRELAKAGIKVTMFVDSAINEALSGYERIKRPDLIFIGADALLKKGVVNKIGSELIAKIAKENKIPVYIVADSWKFTKNKIPLEQRSMNEVWDSAPKNVKIKNPAFEFVHKKYISGIITELGAVKYSQFLRKVKKN